MGGHFRSPRRSFGVIYFDTSYVALLYLNDPGWEEVRTLAETDELVCALCQERRLRSFNERRPAVFGDMALTLEVRERNSRPRVLSAPTNKILLIIWIQR